MGKTDIKARRLKGVFYTPRELAMHLVEPLARGLMPTNIFDPACGNGSLLSAANEVYCRSGSRNQPELFGCDLSPDYDNLHRLQAKHIWQDDFLQLPLTKQFDLVLMNPPYVRHHGIPPETKESYNARTRSICALPKVSDLWAYFLVKAVETVNNGGSLAAILPWSFLQADFARVLRAWLADQFASIDVMAISSRQFEDAEERIALVWLRNKGRPAQSITLGNVNFPTENASRHHLSWSDWIRSRVILSDVGSIHDILSSFLPRGFVPFREVADTRIGAVTGADSFFIVDKQFAIDLGLEQEDCAPIVKTLRDLRGLHLNGNCPDKVLMHFPDTPDNPTLVAYIADGRRHGIHLRAHCIRRKPWYMITKMPPPDALFPYRTSHTPYLVFNKSRCLCTNSIHAITFRELDEMQMKWVQISLLSAPGQLSLEANAKTYGSGVLKIEPTALGNSLVTTGADAFPEKSYRRINALLEVNNRDAASELATDVVRSYVGIDQQSIRICWSILHELRHRRLTPDAIRRLTPGGGDISAGATES